MRTTFDDIPQLGTLGPAEPVVAPSNVFTGADTIWAVLYAAFRDAMADGREPHGVLVGLEQGADVDALVPADAEIVRSAVDDDDVALLAKGLGFTVLLSTAGPLALVSAASREQAQSVAGSLRQQAGRVREPARAEATVHEAPPPGQYL